MSEPKQPAPKKPAPIEVKTLSRRVYHFRGHTGEECATAVDPAVERAPCACGELLIVNVNHTPTTDEPAPEPDAEP
jgi:hypothetical protein